MTNTNSYICSQCGQEYNPPNHICAPNANYSVNTGLYSHDIKAEIRAANNKEWVDRMERRVIGKCLSLEIDSGHCLICEKAGACYIESWQ
jgi:hypothetical protein